MHKLQTKNRLNSNNIKDIFSGCKSNKKKLFNKKTFSPEEVFDIKRKANYKSVLIDLLNFTN